MQDEIDFWRELLKKYLEPLKENKEEQEKIANDLRELRNKVRLINLSRCKNDFVCDFVCMLWNSKVLLFSFRSHLPFSSAMHFG